MKKIDDLNVLYFTYPEGSPEVDTIKKETINISTCCNVSSPFTGFGVPPVGFEGPSQTFGQGTATNFYPNPFTDKTTMRIILDQPVGEIIRIVFYNMQGRLVRTLTLLMYGQGNYEIVWDGRDDMGNPLPSGLFFYTLRINGNVLTGKVLRL